MAQLAQPSGSKERGKRYPTHMDMTPSAEKPETVLEVYVAGLKF